MSRNELPHIFPPPPSAGQFPKPYSEENFQGGKRGNIYESLEKKGGTHPVEIELFEEGVERLWCISHPTHTPSMNK